MELPYIMPTNQRTRASLLVIALLMALVALGASPSIAGTVYVVLASEATVDGLDLSTELVVANPLDEPTIVGMHFIPVGSDGADRPEDFEPIEMTVGAGMTEIFTGLTDGSQRGILEVIAAPLVAVSANLVSTSGTGAKSRTEVPVIGSEELVRGGQFHIVNGLTRDQTKRSSFGIVNLSQSTNECLVQTVGTEGGPLINLTSLAVKPLSSLYFEDALLASGRTTGFDVRIQILCSGDAFPYGVVRDIESGEVSTLRPATDGASSLRAPGTRVVCEPGAFCFEQPGIFLIPSPSNPFVFYDLVPPESNYGSIRVQLTVKLGSFSSIDSAGFHSLFWLYRNLKWNDTFAYLNYRGPNKFLLVNNSLVNTPSGTSNRTTANVSLVPGQTYFVDYLYDARNRSTRATLSDTNGAVVAEMVDRASLGTVAIQNGFRIEVGLERGPVEVPSYGWVYSDLVVIFSP